MFDLIRRTLSSRVASGAMAGLYTQMVQLTILLVSVPVLTGAWGLAGYGAWVLLFTLPQFLSMSDLGLSQAGANLMTAATARGEYEQARRIFVSLRWGSACAMTALAVIVGVLMIVIYPHSMAFLEPHTDGRAWVSICVLLTYTVIITQSLVTEAGFCAAGAFARWQVLYSTLCLIETMIGLAVAASGHGFETVAWTYLGLRIISAVIMASDLRLREKWTHGTGFWPHGPELRALIRPSLAAFLIPAAQGITLQGAVASIGIIGGTAIVPAFSATRTVSRTALQFIYRFNYASAPRYTAHHATEDNRAMAVLMMANFLVTGALLAMAVPLLLWLGPSIIRIWTHGRVHASPELLVLLVAAMALNALWVPLSNFIGALNQHGRFSYVYLALSIVCIGFGTLAVRHYGNAGMAMAMVAQDGLMTIWVWRVAGQMGMIHAHDMREALTHLTSRLLHRSQPQ